MTGQGNGRREHERLLRLGHHITTARVQRGMTRQELADRIARDRRTIDDIERGVRAGSRDTQAAIESALGWPPGEIASILAGNPPTQVTRTVTPGGADVLISSIRKLPEDDIAWIQRMVDARIAEIQEERDRGRRNGY